MVKNPNSPVTNRTLYGAVDGIMRGMDNVIAEMRGLFRAERKYNTETFTTKEDLKREVSWLKDDVKGLTTDLSDTVSKKEFNQLKGKVDKYLAA